MFALLIPGIRLRYDSACTTTRDAVCTPYSVIDFAVLVS